MIDLSKRYKTRIGGEVKGLIKHENKILGWVFFEGQEPINMIWHEDGKYLRGSNDLDLIEVYEKEELLEEARKRYPKGVKFKCLTGILPEIVTKKGQWTADSSIIWDEDGNWCYKDGQWAEIVKEHTVEVYFYEGDEGNILVDADKLPSLNLIAKKKITFYEGEGI